MLVTKAKLTLLRHNERVLPESSYPVPSCSQPFVM